MPRSASALRARRSCSDACRVRPGCRKVHKIETEKQPYRPRTSLMMDRIRPCGLVAQWRIFSWPFTLEGEIAGP